MSDELARFHEEGLVWLVNAAVLHPRGWALTIHISEEGEPTHLSIQGDGRERWCFVPGENAAVLERFERAEEQREARTGPEGKTE